MHGYAMKEAVAALTAAGRRALAAEAQRLKRAVAVAEKRLGIAPQS